MMYVIPLDMFYVNLVSSKSNDITNIFANSILIQMIP